MLAGADGTDNGMVDPNSARKPNGGKKMLPCHQHNDSADNLNMFLCVCVGRRVFVADLPFADLLCGYHAAYTCSGRDRNVLPTFRGRPPR